MIAEAGHHIPTGHPMRNIILLVSATSIGEQLEYSGGQFVPDWGGIGDDENDCGGLPGSGYANFLEERWTEISPAVIRPARPVYSARCCHVEHLHAVPVAVDYKQVTLVVESE